MIQTMPRACRELTWTCHYEDKTLETRACCPLCKAPSLYLTPKLSSLLCVQEAVSLGSDAEACWPPAAVLYSGLPPEHTSGRVCGRSCWLRSGGLKCLWSKFGSRVTAVLAREAALRRATGRTVVPRMKEVCSRTWTSGKAAAASTQIRPTQFLNKSTR